MAATKSAPIVLNNDVTLVAGAGADSHTSGLWTRLTDYGGRLYLKITNGATGPTVAAQAQIWESPDNVNWYKLHGALIAGLGNNVVSSWVIPIAIEAKYVRVISGSNTGQNCVVRAEGVEITAIS